MLRNVLDARAASKFVKKAQSLLKRPDHAVLRISLTPESASGAGGLLSQIHHLLYFLNYLLQWYRGNAILIDNSLK
jgi:hypothetical protein